MKTAEITHVSFQQATGSKIKSEQSIPANALEEEHHARVGFQDSKQVVESYKSGFEPPGDVEFEDYGQAMKRALSECSLGNSRGEARERPAGKGKAKLWPFLKSKNKVRRPRGGFSVDSLTPLDLPPRSLHLPDRRGASVPLSRTLMHFPPLRLHINPAAAWRCFARTGCERGRLIF